MKYPIGIQNFERIRREGYVYVDKTALVYKLVSEGSYYFLSRPRRFGKSLLLSTFEAYFEGKRELFDGLAISEKEKEWLAYPILHIDLNTREYKDETSLKEELNKHLEKWEALYGDRYKDREPEERFSQVIELAYNKTGRQVVVLVDEYDKPLLQAINQSDLQDKYRSTLKAFYGALKSCDKYIKFAFLTGVTKFGKVSVFSDLNNLKDISMLPAYTTICGVTEKELHSCFDREVALLADNNNITKEGCYSRLAENYDGYHFDIDTPGMYNPFSLLNTLDNKVFRDYWFETGTPSYLVYQLQKINYPLERITREPVYVDTLNSIDAVNNPLPLLYQSGYLTITAYDKEFKTYQLGFPNREVENGFVRYLVPFYNPTGKESTIVGGLITAVRNGDAEGFMRQVESFFAGGDYQIQGEKEVYFQNTLYVLFRLMSLYVEVERHTTDGRMDITIQTSDYIYILELKIDQSADVALRQIEDKQYAAVFNGDHRKIFKIGVCFSKQTARLQEWKIQD